MNINREDIKKIVDHMVKLNNFNIHRIDIDTKSPYYKINVTYLINEQKKETMFSEYIMKKKDLQLLHYFSKDKNTNKENYNPKDIIKIFYDESKWMTICQIDGLKKYFEPTFSNIEDIYEILNKQKYYTYIKNNDKIFLLSKGTKNHVEENYNNRIIEKDNEKNKRFCKDGLNCIKPDCIFKHSEGYDLDKAYRDYIYEQRKNNSKFKTFFCKNTDENCSKHKNNRCIFKHHNDPDI